MKKFLMHFYVLILSVQFGWASAYAQVDASAAVSVTELSKIKLSLKEKWGVNYSNYMNGPNFAEGKGGSINHYLGIKRKFGKSWALSGVFRPDSNFSSEEQPMTMGDSYLRLDYPEIYENDGVSLKGNIRYFLPTSESSKKAKTNGVIAPYFQAKQKAGRFDFTYILIPKIYLNTVSEVGQKMASQGHWIAAGYKSSDFVTVDFALYPVWTYKRDSNVEFNNLLAYPGVTFNLSEEFSISPYVEVPLLKAESELVSVGGALSYTFL